MKPSHISVGDRFETGAGTSFIVYGKRHHRGMSQYSYSLAVEWDNGDKTTIEPEWIFNNCHKIDNRSGSK